MTHLNKFNYEELADDIQRVVLPILFNEVKTNENIYVEFSVADPEDIHENGAMVLATGIEDSTQFFEVEFCETLLTNKEVFEKMVCHELVHVMQTLRKDEFNYDLPYFERPHEIEAYDLEEYLVMYYRMNK